MTGGELEFGGGGLDAALVELVDVEACVVVELLLVLGDSVVEEVSVAALVETSGVDGGDAGVVDVLNSGALEEEDSLVADFPIHFPFSHWHSVLFVMFSAIEGEEFC